MRVLVIGGGGREHALCWKLRQSPRLTALYCAPGNAGIARVAECVPVSADDLNKLLRFAREQAIDLTVVGPELPLTMGLVDRFAAAGLRAFGPTAAAARLEGSKAFTKELLRHARVPTAFFGVFTEADDAVRYVNEVGAPVVVKAGGIAGGKGVFICRTVVEPEEAFGGVLYAGLMLQDGRAKVLEFNVRFGDPEAEVILARLRSDLLELLVRTCEGRLAGETIEWDPRAAVCVVLAAEGYPGAVERGRRIDGLEHLAGWAQGMVFHAGTRIDDGRLVTDGGRVLGVTALGDTIDAAVAEAYAGVDRIRWPGTHLRRDIGHRALARERKDGQHGGAWRPAAG